MKFSITFVFAFLSFFGVQAAQSQLDAGRKAVFNFVKEGDFDMANAYLDSMGENLGGWFIDLIHNNIEAGESLNVAKFLVDKRLHNTLQGSTQVIAGHNVVNNDYVIHALLYRGHDAYEAVKYLLDHWTDPNMPNLENETPLDIICIFNETEQRDDVMGYRTEEENRKLVELLIDNGAHHRMLKYPFCRKWVLSEWDIIEAERTRIKSLRAGY